MIKTAKVFLLFLLLAAAASLAAQNVYVTKSGKKYHTESCKSLSHSKIEIALDKAIAAGYTACSVCKPAGASTKTQTTLIRQSSSTQCTALTKAGSRCKRMTNNGNGRCYQHQ